MATVTPGTCLDIVQRFCRRQNIGVPSTVWSSQDSKVLQIAELLNEIIDDLIVRDDWTAQAQRVTWNAITTGYSQGTLASLFPNGYQWLVDKSFWNTATHLPVFGPMSALEWEEALAIPYTNPWYRYRIFDGQLNIFPQPTTTDTFAVEYMSSWPVIDGSSGLAKQYFSLDTDTFALDYRLLILGLRWKWRAEKGFVYTEQKSAYEVMLNELMGHDGTKKSINQCGDEARMRPGVLIPVGNWPVSNS